MCLPHGLRGHFPPGGPGGMSGKPRGLSGQARGTAPLVAKIQSGGLGWEERKMKIVCSQAETGESNCPTTQAGCVLGHFMDCLL